MLTVFETIYNNDLSLPRSQCHSAFDMVCYCIWPHRDDSILQCFLLNGKVCVNRNYMYQRSFVRNSKNRCENLTRFKIRDWCCWDSRLKFLNMSRDFCKQHLFGHCFQAIVVIMTLDWSLSLSVVAGEIHVSTVVAPILCGLRRKFSFA